MPDLDPPTPEEDRRDERLASRLAVEPLDELTRRRLVDTAMRARARRPWFRYVAAAAVATCLAGGGAAALLAGTGGDHGTAARRPARVSGAPGSSSSAAQPVGGAVDLGDFGNLEDPTAVDRLDAVVAAYRQAASPGPASATNRQAGRELAATLAAARACARTTEPVTAVATGRVGNRRALVLVSGTRLTVVLQDPCEARPLR
jgi:hypothetical protein